jgi:hypothetical protein
MNKLTVKTETEKKPICKVCKLQLKTEDILNRHLQYGHDINKGLPVCKQKGCKNRPKIKQKCGLHCEQETNIKVLSFVETMYANVRVRRIIKIDKHKPPRPLTVTRGYSLIEPVVL